VGFDSSAVIAAALVSTPELLAVWHDMDPAQRGIYEAWCGEIPHRLDARARIVAAALGEVVSAPWSRLGPATLADLAEWYGPPVFAGANGELRRAIREDRAIGVYEERAFGGGAVTFIRLSLGGRERAMVSWWYPEPCRLGDSTMEWLAMNPWESVDELLAWLQS
jgi:hypothetical protein